MSQAQPSQEFSVLGHSAKPARVTALSWLWEDRAGEVTSPAPGYQRSRGACLALPAWQELASVMDLEAADTLGTGPPLTSNCPATYSFADHVAPPYDPVAPQQPAPRRQPRRRHHRVSLRQSPAGLGRPASSFTIAQAELSPLGSSALWRGLGLQSSLADHDCQSLELARYRCECASQRAARDRASSKAYRQRTQAPSVRVSQSRRISADDQISRRSLLISADDGDRHSAPMKQFQALNTRGPLALDRRHTPDDLDRGESPFEVLPRVSIGGVAEVDDVLETEAKKYARANSRKHIGDAILHLKRASITVGKISAEVESESFHKRVSSKNSTIQKSRLRRLLDTHKQQFASWPPADQARLRHAFDAGDPKGFAVLDCQGLHIAFAELGLQGRTREEKEAIWMISREADAKGDVDFFFFVFNCVAAVEHKLEELRFPELFKLFEKVDTNGTGRIKEPQALMALKQHSSSNQGSRKASVDAFWAAFVKEFPAMYASKCPGLERTVDFKTFQLLVTQFDSKRADFQHRLEKRIAVVEMLSPELKARHNGALSLLKHFFDDGDSKDAGRISAREATNAILQCGVAPPVGPVWERLLSVMDDCEGALMGFKEFLQVIDGVREDGLGMLQDEIQGLFKSYQWAVAPQIRSNDVPGLMVELESCKDCIRVPEDLPGFVEACDNNDGGDLQIDALCRLVLKVCEKCRASQRDSEAALARQLGCSKKQVLRMREAFASLSDTGYIGAAEVKIWFKEISPDLTPSTKDIEALIGEAIAFSIPPDGRRRTSSCESFSRQESSQAGDDMLRQESCRRDSKASDDASRQVSCSSVKSGAGGSGKYDGGKFSLKGITEKISDFRRTSLETVLSSTQKVETTDSFASFGGCSPHTEEQKAAEDDDDFDKPDEYDSNEPPKVLYFDGFMRLMSMIMKA